MNHESIDDLYARWQTNPDAAQTTALCEALRGGRRPDLVEIVGSHASQQLDVGALLAAARMYTDSGRLDDAQSVLLTAGRIAPREGDIYRWLGEVLLRRGDAERAEKVLEKALQFGAERAAGPLLERARALLPTQRASGPAAVAEAVARSASPYLSQPAPAQPAQPPRSDRDVARDVAAPHSGRRLLPAESDEDIETAIRGSEVVKELIQSALVPMAPPAAGAPVPTPPPSFRAPPGMAAPPPSNPPPPMQTAAIRDDTGGAIVFTTPTRGLGFDIQPDPEIKKLNSDEVISEVSYPRAIAATADFARESARARQAPSAGLGGGLAPPASLDPRRVEVGMPPALEPLKPLARPAPQVGGARVPEPRDVLEALQAAGVFEPDGAGVPQAYTWATPQKTRRIMSVVLLLMLALVLVGGGTGSFYWVTGKRAKEHILAEEVLTSVDSQLRASDERLLDASEKAISRAFELESRSPHAALTWLHERALSGLLKGGADLAFEDAVQRAKAVGIDERNVAFAHVASFLYQGDTAGSAATVAKWDSAAQQDPWFQLLAGATFERAGDSRALERYATAVKLDPDLVIAQVLLTRATAIEADGRRAAELAKDFRARYPDRSEGGALVALTWARDPLRGDAPPEIKDVTERGDSLPPALRAVPHAARAILSLHRGALDEAKPSLQKGLDVADSPGMATWLGSIALATGDEALARKAALAAVSYSAVYAPARVLAARVALLAARLDEALKATEDLPSTWADVAVVAAAASYEKLDSERLGRAFDAVPEDARKQPFVIPLARGQGLLAGNLGVMSGAQALAMADDEAPWADLVAMDWALDAGDVELGKKIADQWKGGTRALRAVRLARLARYDGKLEDADKYSRTAIEGGTVTMRALSERVFTLVALKKDSEALALFKAYPNVGGPLAKWLRAYAVAAHGKIEEAKAIVSQEDPPPSAAPMAARIIAAAAYAMMKDTRHGSDYARPIVLAGFASPDVAIAADKHNLGKVTRRAR
jgi:tetratricopeptide (TPR) repeat protein